MVEGMMPDLLHIIPVGDDAMLDRVGDGVGISHRLVLTTHTELLRDVVMINDCGEHGTGCICINVLILKYESRGL